jgi:hypothetical protein
MLKHEFAKLANDLPTYFETSDNELRKTASEVNSELLNGSYTARDLLKIATMDIVIANDILKSYRDNFVKDDMEKNASFAKRAYEETGYLTKVAEFLSKCLTDDEKQEVLVSLDFIEKRAADIMLEQGLFGEKNRIRTIANEVGTPLDLIKEAAYALKLVSDNINY